jgi:hypothetical protein
MARAMAMAVGTPGSSRDMEVPPGFDPRLLYGTPRVGQPPPVGHSRATFDPS